MPRALATVVCVLLLAFPASAQEAVSATDVGPNAARDFWCASAFGVASANAAEAGDGIDSISLRESMATLFQRLLLEMQAGGYSREQYDVLAADYLRRVLDPFRDAAGGFSRAECENAVTEATAFLEEVTDITP
jgi:hypothetical protein